MFEDTDLWLPCTPGAMLLTCALHELFLTSRGLPPTESNALEEPQGG